MVSFTISDPNRRKVAPPAEVGRTPFRVVTVRGQNVDTALLQHPFRPILRIPPESASEGAGRDLHPHARFDEPLKDGVMGFDPRQSLWVGQNRDISGDDEVEKHILQARRRNVMRRLDQHVTAIGEREQTAGAHTLDEIRYDVNIGASDQP